jgi:hypothetical protein
MATSSSGSPNRNDRLEHTIPAVGAMHVAGTQDAALQIAELIEYEQRVVAGALVMAVSFYPQYLP